MSVQKNLCQFVFYLVGNCVNLCHFGEGFLLMNAVQFFACLLHCLVAQVYVQTWK